MPTACAVKILGLLISFNDYPGVTTPEYFGNRLFGDGVGSAPFDSLRDFYQRSSYNQLTITGNVLGWYQAPYARSTVAETDAGRANLIKEALNYYEAQGHDFSQYDNDGDGAIDYFCVFWTGPHGAWATFWWGYYTWFSDSTYRLDGKRLTNYSWQWELYNYPSGTFSPSTIIPAVPRVRGGRLFSHRPSSRRLQGCARSAWRRDMARGLPPRRVGAGWSARSPAPCFTPASARARRATLTLSSPSPTRPASSRRWCSPRLWPPRGLCLSPGPPSSSMLKPRPMARASRSGCSASSRSTVRRKPAMTA